MMCKTPLFSCSDEEHSIDAAIVLWIVGYLGVLAPDNFTGLRDQTQLTNIHLNDCTLGDHTEGSVCS